MASRFQFLICWIVATPLGVGLVDAAETGQLKLRFEYGGDPPEQKAVPNLGQCGKANVVEEKLIVNKTNKGIKNVIVYLYTGRGGSEIAKPEPPKNVVKLVNKDCRFEPHILVAQAGDTIEVGNGDPFGHNTNLNFFANRALNVIIPAGQTKNVPVAKPERGPIPIDCNIHAWMRSYVVVLDHPFVGVSDDDGVVTINDLPAGKLVFRAFHEAGTIKSVMIDGVEQEWKRSRFEADIQPGDNDMGTMVISADTLK